jgi:hypothetical protein
VHGDRHRCEHERRCTACGHLRDSLHVGSHARRLHKMSYLWHDLSTTQRKRVDSGSWRVSVAARCSVSEHLRLAVSTSRFGLAPRVARRECYVCNDRSTDVRPALLRVDDVVLAVDRCRDRDACASRAARLVRLPA